MEFVNSADTRVIVWMVLGLLEVVFRLTPSEKDNSILNKVRVVEFILPNKAKDPNALINLDCLKVKNRVYG